MVIVMARDVENMLSTAADQAMTGSSTAMRTGQQQVAVHANNGTYTAVANPMDS